MRATWKQLNYTPLLSNQYLHATSLFSGTATAADGSMTTAGTIEANQQPIVVGRW